MTTVMMRDPDEESGHFSRAVRTTLVIGIGLMMVMSAMPGTALVLVGNDLEDHGPGEPGKGPVSSVEGGLVPDDGHGKGKSRLKEFPNTDTWEWVNPVPAHNFFNDVMWQPNGDIAVVVGHSGMILEKEGDTWTTIQSNTIYNFWHIEWRPQGDYGLIVGNHGVAIKYTPGEAQHLDTDTVTRLQGAAWKDDGSYALICGWEGILLKYDGSSLTRIDTGITDRLYNVSYDQDTGWLITGEKGMLLSYDEPTGKVEMIETGIDDMLFNLDTREGVALIVGGNGTVLRYDGSDVSKVSNSITSVDLFGIEWDLVNGYALICGENGKVLMYESPGGLSDISPVTTNVLRSISFLNDGNDALVVGSAGTVFSYVHGMGWTQLSELPFEASFRDVAWAPNGSYALIVGSGGTVLRYNDTTGISSMNSTVSVTLRGLSWAPNGSYALIVGDGGTILRYNGTNFTELDAGVLDRDLLAVDFREDGEYAIIVGAFGSILKYDGQDFHTIVPEDQGQFFLFSVAFHPISDYAVVAGASGMAYKCEEDPAPKYQPAGIKCLRLATGVFTTLRDVEFRDDGAYGILVGLSGVVLRYEGGGFTEVPNDAKGHSLGDIKWKTDSIYPVIVGGGGMVMKYSGYGGVKLPCPAVAALNGMSWKGTSAIVVGDKSQILIYNSPPLNQPFASIKSPGEGEEFTIEDDIEFNGFHSLAPDDATVQFFWISNISGALSTSAKFTDTLPLGKHRITLYVNTTDGRSDSDQVDVNVILNARPPVPVISSPVDGRTYTTDESIFFDASDSSDPNGDTLSYFWSSDIEGFLASGTGFHLGLSVVGLHMITLWAFDGTFNVSTSVNITVQTPNSPPDISIVSPTALDEIHEGDNIRFEATALDPDGDGLNYTWQSNRSGYLDDHKMFLGTLEEGHHMITFWADDGEGHNVSAHVNITVLPFIHINEPPLLEILYPEEGDEISGIINVTGTASDPDGSLVAVEYRIGSDNWRATEGQEDWKFTWDTLEYENEEHIFKVRAYDGENFTVLEMTVTISNKWKDVHAHFLYPVDGLEVSGTVEIKGRAYHDQVSDGHYINSVEVKVDDEDWQVAHGTDPWVLELDTTDYENGAHTVSVRAKDDEGTYSDVQTITIQIENQDQGLGTSSEGLALLAIAIIILVVIIALVVRSSRKRARDERMERELDLDRELEEEELDLDRELEEE